MAVRITTGQSSVSRTAVTGSQTTVKKVTVGSPVKIVRRLAASDVNINTINGVDTSTRIDGSLLVYDASSGLWKNKEDLDNNNIQFNGGNF